ncbi:glutathione S-transferase [Accumulibacter sp.]|uniref:glutathione S-transferase n=1 Tax=Accumulibacter sp. TaxID=2053492 RepID=UPI0025F8972B|nr:glutathione S-transferase [Accumulibacter sp.]MCM8596623.1 glutathione S-transferase [Accumulibacter sp.]MCM8627542.1 glutathione S-transferase [Accumulibacter sp.]MDS4050771.1 glutathione S-transferase [Accumulibacter sp.]
MKLVGSLTSPYVRKVRVVLAEKKIDYDFELDSPWLAGNTVAEVNPLGKIPVLVLDDNTTLFDSRVIVEYLDNVAPNNKLMPAPNRERAEVRRWEALADGVCDSAALIFLERKRPIEQQSSEWTARQQDKILRSLEFMASELAEHPWCAGTHFSLADVAVGCALGYLVFRFPEIDWQERHPNLARLYAKLIRRPGFAETVPQG